jgi:hypothetical protein
MVEEAEEARVLNLRFFQFTQLDWGAPVGELSV